MNKTKCFLIVSLITAFISSAVVSAFPLVQMEAPVFENNVVVSNGQQIILINGKEHTMPAEVYYSDRVECYMVPVRYICLAVGLPESAVKWDSANSAITIDTGRRQIWLQTGKTHYYLNRALVPIVGASGNRGTVEIVDGRAYVPYNTMGEALNITFGLTIDGTGVRYNFPE